MDLSKIEELERLVQIKLSLESVHFLSTPLDNLIRDGISELKEKYVRDSKNLPKFPENSLISCDKV